MSFKDVWFINFSIHRAQCPGEHILTSHIDVWIACSHAFACINLTNGPVRVPDAWCHDDRVLRDRFINRSTANFICLATLLIAQCAFRLVAIGRVSLDTHSIRLNVVQIEFYVMPLDFLPIWKLVYVWSGASADFTSGWMKNRAWFANSISSKTCFVETLLHAVDSIKDISAHLGGPPSASYFVF